MAFCPWKVCLYLIVVPWVCYRWWKLDDIVLKICRDPCKCSPSFKPEFCHSLGRSIGEKKKKALFSRSFKFKTIKIPSFRYQSKTVTTTNQFSNMSLIYRLVRVYQGIRSATIKVANVSKWKQIWVFTDVFAWWQVTNHVILRKCSDDYWRKLILQFKSLHYYKTILILYANNNMKNNVSVPNFCLFFFPKRKCLACWYTRLPMSACHLHSTTLLNLLVFKPVWEEHHLKAPHVLLCCVCFCKKYKCLLFICQSVPFSPAFLYCSSHPLRTQPWQGPSLTRLILPLAASWGDVTDLFLSCLLSSAHTKIPQSRVWVLSPIPTFLSQG